MATPKHEECHNNSHPNKESFNNLNLCIMFLFLFYLLLVCNLIQSHSHLDLHVRRL